MDSFLSWLKRNCFEAIAVASAIPVIKGGGGVKDHRTSTDLQCNVLDGKILKFFGSKLQDKHLVTY